MAIQIRDEAGLLNSSDLASLQAAADRWPFDVHIITSTSSPNKAAFESRVSAAVDDPNVVAIGIDPTHHTTIVHFGKETGVPPSQWAAISSAGNADFKGGHWADGLTNIMNRSLGAKQQASAVTLQPSKAPGADHTWLWVTGGVILGLAAIIGVYYWLRARRQAAERQRQIDIENDLLAEKAARNREERDWADKYREREAAPKMEDEVSKPRSSYRSPAPTPPPSPKPKKLIWGEPVAPYRHVSPAPSTVVVNNSSNNSNDLALGYVLGRLDEPRRVEREVVYEEPRRHHHHESSSSSSFWGSSDDAGGSSSSFGSSSSSDDSGGSSSSWSSDSGGSSSSFDSGGGGFDSGGGSSDW